MREPCECVGALAHGRLAAARDTIRRKLLKIGTQIRIGDRRTLASTASASPSA